MIHLLKKLCLLMIQPEDGAVMVEYIFLIIFIAMVALIGIKTFGQAVRSKMGSNNNSVTNAIN
jgi:Flp pilus assembly pilin Flp